MGYQLKVKLICITVSDDLEQNAAFVHLKFTQASHQQSFVKAVSLELSAVYKSQVPIVLGTDNDIKIAFESLPFNECIYHLPAESLALEKQNGKLEVLVPGRIIDVIRAHINQTLRTISQSAHPIELEWNQSIEAEHRFTRTTSNLYEKMRQPELKISRKRKNSINTPPAEDCGKVIKEDIENFPPAALLFSVAKTLSEMNKKQPDRQTNKAKDRTLSRSP